MLTCVKSGGCRIEGEEEPLYYGGRCEKWEIEDRKGKGQDIPNLFRRKE